MPDRQIKQGNITMFFSANHICIIVNVNANDFSFGYTLTLKPYCNIKVVKAEFS